MDGKSTESFLIAIVVINESYLNNLKESLLTNEEDMNDVKIRSFTLKILQDFGKKSGLTGLEQIRNIYLTNEEFTLDSGLLTPTLKLRRLVLSEKFKDIIQKLYIEGPLFK